MPRAEGWFLPRLSEWRRYRVLSPSELAERAKISRPSLSRIENLKARAGTKTIASICEVLGISREQLLYEDPPFPKIEATAA